ncbi:PspA/IM30 family protein [Neobacillus sp. SM06]|uniref:PspA/IM30 family protein n=1 Tax=Neobacillus sp. SM06 TaxID=3422492 RepID=UPI003D2C8F8C
MGIFKRLKTIVSADVHEVLDKMENPLSMLSQYLRDVENQLEEAKGALADQLYLEKKYELLVADEEALVAKRARQAELAVTRGEDEIAKLALQEKILHETKVNRYRQQYEITKQQTENLKEQISKLVEEFQELQYKRLVLTSRAHAAKSIQQGQAMLASFQSEQAVSGFAKAEEQVRKLEAAAAASTHFYELTNASGKAALDTQLQEAVQKELDLVKQG